MNKKRMIFTVIISMCIIVITVVYNVYGNTLIDIRNETSISDNFATSPSQPINILATAQLDDYFGVLYSDPVDANEGCYHFKYITKAKFYKNKYHNIGGSGTSINETEIMYDILNARDKNNKTVNVFLYTFNSTLFENNKCSVFEYCSDGYEMDYSKITDEKQIVEKMQKLADSYKKIDEFELPNEKIFIIPKTYELSSANNQISFINGSVSIEDLKEQTMNEANLIVKEYRDYLKEAKQWKRY